MCMYAGHSSRKCFSSSTLLGQKGRKRKSFGIFGFECLPFCPNKVEDEKHFLLECPAYIHIRSDLYNEAKNIFPTITNQPYSYRFRTLMKESLVFPVPTFIYRAMEVREFLLVRPRCHE
jgi:hypothetical protein